MFEIFQPFNKVNKNSDVFICTWGIAGSNKMKQVVDKIRAAKNVKLLIGFSKQTHDLNLLKDICIYYSRLGWQVKVLPSFHAKIWKINNDYFVGSCNFFPNTIHNYMHKTTGTKRLKKFIETFWNKGFNVTQSSKLWLLPQK